MDSEKILNLILSEIYTAPTQSDFLVYDEKNARFIVGGEILPVNKSAEIIAAAHELSENILFQYLIKELEYDGAKKMAVQAADWERTRFAKANIYAAWLIREKVNKIKILTIKPKKVATKKEGNE